MKFISRTVWILSFVSLFTDMASEMLYPIMPVYLKSIGFSIFVIGILEGVAEATAGLSKAYFGKRSDLSGKRVPFVQIGYVLSTISKPLMVLFTFPLWVFFARTLDRFGKGIRTGARDAMLSDQATPNTKGTVFGLHRSMDTLGAVLGPLLALMYLYAFPHEYKMLFLLAFLPGLAAVIASFLLKEKQLQKSSPKKAVSFFSSFRYWRISTPEYRKLVVGLLLFTLFNSSDVFLLLKAKEAGCDDLFVIELYIFYNLIYAAFALPTGMLADKIGMKRTFIFGLILFVLSYVGMSLNTNHYLFFGLFFVYGLYAAATEGISKAWISNITNTQDTATAIGTFTGFQSVCAMLASSITGLLWFKFGAMTALMASALGVCIVISYLIVVTKSMHTINDVG
jgi:MFS family permease